MGNTPIKKHPQPHGWGRNLSVAEALDPSVADLVGMTREGCRTNPPGRRPLWGITSQCTRHGACLSRSGGVINQRKAQHPHWSLGDAPTATPTGLEYASNTRNSSATRSVPESLYETARVDPTVKGQLCLHPFCLPKAAQREAAS